jgi:hypothetical protein
MAGESAFESPQQEAATIRAEIMASHGESAGCVLPTDPRERPRFWPVGYVLSAWRTHLGWMSFALVLASTWGGLWSAGWVLGNAQPVEIVINHVEVLDAPNGTAGRTLRVEITVPPPGNCFRLSNHFLFSDGVGVPTFYALGSAMNGGGFRLRNGAGFGMQEPPGKPMDFAMVFSIPQSIPAGQYQYANISMYIEASTRAFGWVGLSSDESCMKHRPSRF